MRAAGPIFPDGSKLRRMASTGGEQIDPLSCCSLEASLRDGRVNNVPCGLPVPRLTVLHAQCRPSASVARAVLGYNVCRSRETSPSTWESKKSGETLSLISSRDMDASREFAENVTADGPEDARIERRHGASVPTMMWHLGNSTSYSIFSISLDTTLGD